ncbi:MAG: acyltransferase family protein [archaeon]|nr:acyltransferase family protein [archaeon]
MTENVTKIIKPRVNKYDNLKGLGILLIVFGHCLYGLPGIAATIRQGIYIFHLPLFFFVAGYFSRIRPDIIEKSTKRLLIPYIVLSIISFLFCIPAYTTGTLFFNPYGGLWFLLSLYSMKLLLPILNKLKHPVIITFIIALLVGFIKINGEILFTTRTFSFLPIFMLGFKFNQYKPKFEEKLANLKLKNLITNTKFLIIILFVLFGASMVIGNYITQELVEMAHAYDVSNILTSFEMRFLIIIIGILTTLVLNELMTNNETFLTKFGRNSLAVYLLHILMSNLQFLAQNKTGFINSSSGNLFMWILFSLASSFVITFVLSRDPVTRVMNQVFDSATDIITAVCVEIKRPLENNSVCLKLSNYILNIYHNYYL